MKLFTKIRCELEKGTRVSLKCSVAIYFKPELIVGDSVMDTVSTIIYQSEWQ